MALPVILQKLVLAMETKKQDISREAYEMSVSAYQFSIKRYNSWMNMYAIITGALFVALYSILYVENNFYVSEAITVLTFVIVVLGIASNTAWILTVRGHYEWTKSFIRILKCNENQYFRGDFDPEKAFVYDGVMISANKSPNHSSVNLPGFFSTQKITIIFLKLLLSAWFFVGLYLWLRNWIASLFFAVLIFIILIAFNYELLQLLKCLCSEIDKVYYDNTVDKSKSV